MHACQQVLLLLCAVLAGDSSAQQRGEQGTSHSFGQQLT
jgi:hypothetical protein